uniref:Uncharacterized protein n=1 Tax=Anguilla anguilla TaxID=7936 RepID=A0A0E9SIE2_ANGAN
MQSVNYRGHPFHFKIHRTLIS